MCCGNNSRPVRTQKVTNGDAPLKAARVYKAGMVVNRQSLVAGETCPCGYPIMLVNIVGRERRQCSNNHCRKVFP